MRKNDISDESNEFYPENENSPSSANSKLVPIIVVLFIMIATAALAILIMLVSDKLTVQFVFNAGLTMALILGLCLLIIPPARRKKKQSRCTMAVTLHCVDLIKKIQYDSDNHQHKTVTYAPVWEYWYNGRSYVYAENVYTNVDVPEIGSEREGFIDPDKPSELFRPDPAAAAILMFMAIIITFVGTAGLIVVNILFRIIESA